MLKIKESAENITILRGKISNTKQFKTFLNFLQSNEVYLDRDVELDVSLTCPKTLSNEFSNIKVNQAEIQSFFDKYCLNTVYHIHKEVNPYIVYDIYCWIYNSHQPIYLGFSVYYGACPSGRCDSCNVKIHMADNPDSLVDELYWINDLTKRNLISHLQMGNTH